MTATKYSRKHECSDCGHKWRSPVRLTDHATSLSGEAREWCPLCHTGNVASQPAIAKRDRMLERIRCHGENLLVIFPDAAERDPDKLCRKLRRLEAEAEQFALRLCNGPEFGSENEADKIGDVILSKVDRLLRYSAAGVPVFLNRDPRGYSLKIKDAWVRKLNESGKTIHTDWGGYGILAPDLSND